MANSSNYDFIREKDRKLLFNLGEVLLGYEKDELGEDFIEEADAFITNLEGFLRSDVRRLLNLFNSRFMSLLISFKLTKFVDMTYEEQTKYYNSWAHSRLGLLRTGASTLRALCGWSLYSLEITWDELNLPGKTIGREDETPTLLEGKMTFEEYKEELQ